MALEKKSPELTTWNPELECWEGTISGRLTREWCDDNEYLHRERGPAWIGYHKNGIPTAELWFLHGRLHRAGAPAWIRYHEDGTPSNEEWWLHGELHRAGGPAEIWYYQDGTPSAEAWWLHDEESTPLYPHETLVTLIQALGIEGFRNYGNYGVSLFILAFLCPDLPSLLK